MKPNARPLSSEAVDVAVFGPATYPLSSVPKCQRSEESKAERHARVDEQRGEEVGLAGLEDPGDEELRAAWRGGSKSVSSLVRAEGERGKVRTVAPEVLVDGHGDEEVSRDGLVRVDGVCGRRKKD